MLALDVLVDNNLIAAAQVAAALVALGIGAVYDLKTRSIPSKLAYAFVLVELALLAYRVYTEGLPRFWTLYAAVDALLIGFTGLMVLLCMKGPGDLYMLTGAVLSTPWGAPLLPASLALLLYYSVYSIIPSLLILASNIASRNARLAARRLPLHKRIYRLLTARPLPAKILARRGSWWIPLDISEAKRSVCDANIDPWEVVERAIRERKLREDELVWATYGIPALVTLLAAYITLLLLGDTPITLLLARLLSPKG